MKLLHTADWHLCDKLGTIARQDDLERRVERIALLCEEYQIDVVLIAGDLFFENARADDVAQALRHLHGAFVNFFARGGVILAITGNHDRDSFINPVLAGMKLASPLPDNKIILPGRMYLVNWRDAVRFTKNGETVQFVLLPYPNAHRYGEPEDKHATREEQHRCYLGRITNFIQKLVPEKKIDVSLPTVLLAHLTLAGVQAQNRHQMNEADSITLQDIGLLDMFAYVALGDIHEAQMVQRNQHIRYSGSLDRLDFGEKDNTCGVVLVEIANKKLQGEPRFVEIPATPLLELHLADAEAELSTLAAQYPQRDEAIFKITVSSEGLSLAQDDVRQQLRRMFRRIKEITFVRSTLSAENSACEVSPRKTVHETVVEYLHDKLKDHPERQTILDIAAVLMQQE